MSTKEFEHAYYIGNYLSAILYGIELVMYSLSMSRLLRPKRARQSLHNSSRTFLALYSTALLLLVTVDIATNAVWGEQMWITSRDRPGGVPAFIDSNLSVWYETLSSTSVVVMIFMGDALLIYRLYVIYESNRWLIVLPCLTWCTALSLAIIQLAISGKPGGDFFNGKTLNFGTPYYAMTIGMNILITSLICGRLFYYSRRIRRLLGTDTADTYTGIAAILIESAAPYSIVGLMFLIPYAQGSATAIAFGQVWAKMTCLSPQLIILRVITGTAWGKDTISSARNGGRGAAHNNKSIISDEVMMTTGIEFSPVAEVMASSDPGCLYSGGGGTLKGERESEREKDEDEEDAVGFVAAAKSGSTLVYHSSVGYASTKDGDDVKSGFP
jgi:hypothetical protein